MKRVEDFVAMSLDGFITAADGGWSGCSPTRTTT